MPDAVVEAVRDSARWFEPGIGGIAPLVDAAALTSTPDCPISSDAVIHGDTTTALTPLERWSREEADLPDTYPTGV